MKKCGHPAMTAERFWKKVDKNGPIVRPELGPCWLWPRINKQGYGKTTVLLKHWSAHRLAWTYAKGAIPEGLCICHKCDVRNCVRPDHLFLGTSLENNDDKVQKRRHVYGQRAALYSAKKLNLQKAEEIRILYAQGVSSLEIAQRYGIVRSYVSQIIRRESWNFTECTSLQKSPGT